MDGDKDFLTYNQQMKHLRKDKSILCKGSEDKTILCRYGYFNLVNGYKTPFVCGTDEGSGRHLYIPGTSIKHLNYVRKFDDNLRILLLKYISLAEEEVRTFFAYKFDELNKKGEITWYQIEAFNTKKSVNRIVSVISKAYHELSQSRAEYVSFYMDKHKFIPMWILIKCINFSTFIDFIDLSKDGVKISLCNLYNMYDARGYADFKLLIGSLQWMRIVRNACAHNERIYTIRQKKLSSGSLNGRIQCEYLNLLPEAYRRESEKRVIDLLIYLKYYLSTEDFNILIDELNGYLAALKEEIHRNAFDYVRGQLGIKHIGDLMLLKRKPKDIQYSRLSIVNAKKV